MATKKLVISSIMQFMSLAAKTPAVLNVGGFTGLRPHLAKEGCGKCARARAILSDLRPQWEASFSVLSASEQKLLKTLLDAEQICYLVKQPNGQFKLNCF